MVYSEVTTNITTTTELRLHSKEPRLKKDEENFRRPRQIKYFIVRGDTIFAVVLKTFNITFYFI